MGRGSKSKRTTASSDRGPVEIGHVEDPPPPSPQSFDIFHKTKMCKFFIMGMCTRGESCQYAHSKEDLQIAPDLKCTKLCQDLIQTGQCRDPANCLFAHNKQELRISATCRNRRQALSNMKELKAKSKSEGSSASRSTLQPPKFRGTPQSKASQGRHAAASECSTAPCSFASNGDNSLEVLPNTPIAVHGFYGEESESSASEFTLSEAGGTSFCSSRGGNTSFCSSIQEDEVESFRDRFKKMFFWNQADQAEKDIGFRVSVKNTFLDFQDDDTAVFRELRKSCSAEGRLDVLEEDDVQSDTPLW